MLETITSYEGAVRFGAFLTILSGMALWESLAPRRNRVAAIKRRWPTNFLILLIDTLAIRIVFPIVAVGAALWAESQGMGLFNWLSPPVWLELILGLVVLDLAIYGQHVAFHRVPLLWRLHRVHHVDRDVDVTTALRFHPFEIALSLLYKMALAVALGLDPAVIVLFEVVLNGLAMFNHGNVRLPRPVDAVVRLIFVTPDMHRVHHSTQQAEHDSNYGNALSIWDRLFGTYTAQPAAGHHGMAIGLKGHESGESDGLRWSLLFPFRS